MSGTFDIASGTLNHTEVPSSGSSPLAGTVNFLDNNGVLAVRGSTITGTFNTATINGFTAGDRITYEAYYKATGLSYDPATHKLALTLPGGDLTPPSVQFTLAGTYAQSDFQIACRPGPPDSVGISQTTLMDITTTNTANAIPGFTIQDTVTGAAASSAGQQYTGPVSYLQSQYIWASADGANVASNLPNAFVGGGAGNDALAASAGSNVLDGGLGSNFLTGATGADGGRDTFFLDGSAGTTWDTVANFHRGDSVTLWGFVPGKSTQAWAANEGAAGHTGATLHSAFAGAGTAVNGSVTFAGLSLADAQGKISLTPGTAGGRSYLYAHYNG